MNTQTVSAFKRANTILNRATVQLSGPGIRLKVLYWGFMPEHYDNTPHRHSFFEACYVMEGQGIYMEDDREYELLAGTVFLSRPGKWHQIRSKNGMALCYAAFELIEEGSTSSYIQAYRHLAEKGVPVLQDAAASPTANLWSTIVSMFKETSSFPALAVHHTALTLLISLLPLHGGGQDTLSETTQVKNEGNPLFRQAKLFIDDNISENLTLQLVAQHLHISSRHLTRLFAQEMNQTFVHYIQERRVQLAAEMLLQEELEIKDIASRCGFESVHYFTRVFSRKLGVAPARFRRAQFTEGRSGSQHFPAPPSNPTST
ncbi:AraC family transcriptional regulator [Paenibacillus sp. UMB4589-SE434]|uniref:AraC family transcriptional regulator n=1 Tax=Paenibacillus sp. UMB4589-SE434 TaxID=3046314 RepID=UPI00254A6070|nr:AraC family transcriptional regulator [Paenibacillus sp. UMB4589-SE434]MDK8181540.1 AraC family transcriptional regulator [Paenibacillus sp. UMB4589-SE434]